MNTSTMRPPLPPFAAATAAQKVRLAEDAWNTRDPDVVVRVYTEDTRWRNRAEFPVGHAQVHAFLARKCAFDAAPGSGRLAVRFAYEWRDKAASGFAATATRTGTSTRMG